MDITIKKPTSYVFKPENNEFLIWPREKASMLLQEAFALGPAKKQVQEKLESLSKKDKEPRKVFAKSKCEALKIHFSEGGSTQILLLESGAPIFEIQKSLSKNFGKDFNATKTCILRIQHFGKSENSLYLSWALELSLLSGWKPTHIGEAEPTKKAPKAFSAFEIYSDHELPDEGIMRAQSLAEAINLVRTLADLPGNELNPAKYRQKIEAFAKEKKLGFKFLDCAQLKKMGAGAFMAVARGEAAQKSGIAKLSYKGPKAKKKLVLVGKGLCFDTGGYNIKTGAHMYGMEKDMIGSAIALSLIGLLAATRAPLEVEAYLAITENLISPEAFRPNDVVQAVDGTTIEVIDTDAEGRMVLADTLALARREKAALVLDFATLTGASIRAVDTFRSTAFSNQKDLLGLAVEVGDRCGDRVWPFPIGDDYFDALKSEVADIRQLAAHNNADHIYAATFLSHFVGAETPWVHIDLASGSHKGGLGLVSSETTGTGVRWALEFIESHLL